MVPPTDLMITKVEAWWLSFLTSASSQKQECGWAPSLSDLPNSTSSLSCSRLSDLISEDIVTQRCGCKSFMLQGIPSTKKDCGLIILVTWPILNLVLWHLDTHAISNLVRIVPRTWYIIFWCDTVPVDSLQVGTAHPACYPLHHAVTLLHHNIPSWSVWAMKLQVNSPIMCKSSKLSAAEGCAIVCKEFVCVCVGGILKEHRL